MDELFTKANKKEDNFLVLKKMFVDVRMHLSMSSWQGIGRGFDRSLWPRGRAFELSCCSGSRDAVEPRYNEVS